MNRINKKLQEDKKLLSIYFTAGYPKLMILFQLLKAWRKVVLILLKSDYLLAIL